MSSWFDYDDDDLKVSIKDEILADNCLILAPSTCVFMTLIEKDLTQDYVDFTFKDFERMIARFINCGYPIVRYTFTKGELEDWFNAERRRYFFKSYGLGTYKWTAIMDHLAPVNELSAREVISLDFDEEACKQFLLFCCLQIDFRLIDRKNEHIFPWWLNSRFDSPVNGNVPEEEIYKKLSLWKKPPSRLRKG